MLNLLTFTYLLGHSYHTRLFCTVRQQIVSPKLLFANHFSQVLDDKLSRAERLLGANAPALALGTESLQTLHPFMSLDVLVVTLFDTWTGAGRALSKAHPGEMGD